MRTSTEDALNETFQDALNETFQDVLNETFQDALNETFQPQWKMIITEHEIFGRYPKTDDDKMQMKLRNRM